MQANKHEQNHPTDEDEQKQVRELDESKLQIKFINFKFKLSLDHNYWHLHLT
jgi:hypothetical protein